MYCTSGVNNIYVEYILKKKIIKAECIPSILWLTGLNDVVEFPIFQLIGKNSIYWYSFLSQRFINYMEWRWYALSMRLQQYLAPYILIQPHYHRSKVFPQRQAEMLRVCLYSLDSQLYLFIEKKESKHTPINLIFNFTCRTNEEIIMIPISKNSYFELSKYFITK